MSEEFEARRDGAKLQKNSGRGMWQKSDAVIENIFTVDYKEYEKSFSLSRSVWAKVCKDTLLNGNNTSPALKIILGKGIQKLRLWVVSEDIIDDYIRLRRLEEQNE